MTAYLAPPAEALQIPGTIMFHSSRALKSLSLLLLLAGIHPAGAETQTVVFDLATKTEEHRRRAYEQANVVNLAARREPQAPVKGKVIQQLKGTSYLMMADDGTTSLIDLLPGRGPVPQGTAISCSVEYIGLYQYPTVEGVVKKVKHWKELTEAERTGKKWKTYPEFCDWLRLGHTCVLRKTEQVRCTLCTGTGRVREAATSPATPCPRCGGDGRDTLTTLYNLVWTTQPRTAPPAAAPPAAAPPAAAPRAAVPPAQIPSPKQIQSSKPETIELSPLGRIESKKLVRNLFRISGFSSFGFLSDFGFRIFHRPRSVR